MASSDAPNAASSGRAKRRPSAIKATPLAQSIVNEVFMMLSASGSCFLPR